MNHDVRTTRLMLAILVEPGDREVGTLVRRYGPQDTLRHLLDHGSAGRSRAVECCAPRLAALGGPDGLRRRADEAAAHTDRLGGRFVVPEDEEWLAGLGDLVRVSRETGDPIARNTDPPLGLWVRGSTPLHEALDRSVAVVGARAATEYGRHVAAQLGYGLGDRGWTVVSGGAFGIDAAAHRGALASGGLTVAVLACGVDRPYPLAHTTLFERIADEGLLVSEWPPGEEPRRTRFLVRNRVIAAATRGTVLVEAAARSGARQTLGRARLLGRPAMAVPGPVTSELSAGCHAELRVPGTVLVADAAEVIEEVGRIGYDLAPLARGSSRPHDRLDPVCVQVLDAVLPRRPRTAERIAAAAGLSGRDARRALPLLVQAGFVVAAEDGYRLAPQPPQPSAAD